MGGGAALNGTKYFLGEILTHHSQFFVLFIIIYPCSLYVRFTIAIILGSSPPTRVKWPLQRSTLAEE